MGFSLIMRQLTAGTPLGATYFPDVGQGMMSLLLRGTMPDNAEFVETASAENVVFSFIVLFYIFASVILLLNMLIGILCEVVSVTSAVETEQLLVTGVKRKLQDLLGKYGVDE